MISDETRIIDLTVGELKHLFISLSKSEIHQVNSQTKQDRRELRLIDLEKLCMQYGFAKQTVYTWVFEKKIPFIKIGKRLKFDTDEINTWIEKYKYKARERSRYG